LTLPSNDLGQASEFLPNLTTNYALASTVVLRVGIWFVIGLIKEILAERVGLCLVPNIPPYTSTTRTVGRLARPQNGLQ